MAIIKHVKDENIKYAYLNVFPDQFKSEKEKEDKGWIKQTIDYFSNKAYAEYVRNKETFVKNYDLMKGILRREDFYEDEEVKSFTEILTQDLDLPSYVKHYSIVTTPINELIGEMTKRPDTYMVKAFDDESRSEELQFKTDLLQQFIVSQAKAKILSKVAAQGIDISEEEIEQMTIESVKDQLDGYTSIAEKWANHVLTCTKADYNIKEKAEDMFRDLCLSAREYVHIYEDNSKTGFNIEVLNPKNVWFLTTPDRKYLSDPSGRLQGAYAAGTVNVMEISEVIETFPDLTKEEIDHLRTALDNYGLINVRQSNLDNPNIQPGTDTIIYDTYDPLVLQERMQIESDLKENNDSLRDFLGLTANVSSFGYKYVVVRAYWVSKKKIGKLVYVDEMGNIQSTLVDESYKNGTIPTQISLEWGWINQWYQGYRIGPDIYHIKPFKLLSYCPIIGMVYEQKNTEAKSVLDLMKPFQVIYNVCMNQLFDLLRKELGNVASINIRRIPKLKDGDDQDALDMWEMEARERGIVFDDDSPENTKAPVSNTSIAKNIDLTRTNEIQSRYTLAVQMKNECWELVGMSKQRMGNISPSESATGTNTAVQQSYSQTEPLFVAHEYIMGQFYQAIIDAALYVESKKPESTISYINSEGQAAFVQVNGSDLKFRDLKVFPTNRPEDVKMFNELRLLAQAVIQNGGSLYDIIELYSTKSMRQMKKTFRELRDRQLELQENEQRIKEKQIEEQRQIAAAQMDEARRMRETEMANENYQRDLDRINKKEIAIISATGFGEVGAEDSNANNVPDVLETSKFEADKSKALREYNLKVAELEAKNTQALKKLELEKEKLQVDRENQKNDLAIARENAKSRNKSNKKK